MEDLESYVAAIGRAARHIRTRQEKSEAAVANAAGVSEARISAVENGADDLLVSELWAIGGALSEYPSVVLTLAEYLLTVDDRGG